MTVLYARLKPRPKHARKGVPRTPGRYMIHGVRFSVEKGWVKITDDTLLAELRTQTHNNREDGAPIFDICTKKEAEAIDAREKRAGVERTSVADATEAPAARRARSRSGALSSADTKPEPAMIDGADGEEEETEETESGDETLGRVGNGPAQELDDGDDLLESGGRTPRAPKVVKVEKPASRRKAATAPAGRTRSARAATE
jgi:hypothetical protein